MNLWMQIDVGCMPQLGSLLAQRLVDFTEEREDIRKRIEIPLLI